MSYMRKLHLWQLENQKSIEEYERDSLLGALAIYDLENDYYKNKIKKFRRHWVNPVFQMRKKHGFYYSVYPVLELQEAMYRNYFRMNSTQLENLLQLIGPKIQKQNCVREPIPPKERLCLTLRYLASGDSLISMTYQYLMGASTVSGIINETCEAIWDSLMPIVLKYPLTEDDWFKIENDFNEKWNFPHCIGAIDGRHVCIQAPDNAGSAYFNYKHFHSIVLLGICDANYMFTFVDIGAYGRRSDGGIFKDSALGQLFDNKKMNLPEPQSLSPGGALLPYVLVGDAAFRMTEYLLRPYPGKNLDKYQEVYSYRHSRAKRMIENTFGILVNRWRVLRRSIVGTVEKATKIVQAVVCLHNWLRQQDLYNNVYVPPNLVDHEKDDQSVPGLWRLNKNSAFESFTGYKPNRVSTSSLEIRDHFCHYFNSEGAVDWQYYS